MKTTHSVRSPRAAFTLTEALIATVLAGIVIAGVTTLLISGLRYYYTGRDKLQISQDIRSLTLDLMGSARSAADFRIYDNFDTRAEQTGSGAAGDMVAFLYADPNDEAKVVRVITYYRDLGKQNKSTELDQTLRRYDTGDIAPVAFSASLLPDAATRTQNRAIVETTADSTMSQQYMFQRVFYGLNAPDALGASGQIVYWNKALKRFQNTYDFVVACRS